MNMIYAYYKVTDLEGVVRVTHADPEEIRRMMANEDVVFFHPEAAVLFAVNCLFDRINELEQKMFPTMGTYESKNENS
jgi:hypothetical protein